MRENPKVKKAYSDKYQGTFIWGFLKIAKNSLQDLKKKKNIGKKNWFPGTQKKPIYDLEDKGLWVAIIWNTKHAMELLIKTLGIQVNKEYLMTHDLNELINDIEGRLKDKTRKITINRLKKIIGKYYRSEIFAGKKLVRAVDMQNDFFRYTDNSAKVDIDFQLFDRLSRKDINTMEKDINFLYKLFLSTENEIRFVPKMKGLSMSKSEINKTLRRNRPTIKT